ncbi:MAG: transposase [Kiritimatiellae bacterium]|nr:transposase [Kiritimatiellia bacterium]
MPNHIHVLFRPKSGHALSDIVHSWKSFTAKELLKHGGRDARPPVDRVWQEDYWDRLIRNERHLNACRRYIVENPTRAHLEDGSFVLHGSAGVSPVIPGGQNARADDPGGQDARPPMRFDPQNAEAYLDKMIRLLREDGVRFPDNKAMKFSALEIETGGSAIHARGTWVNGDKKERQVAVIVGPQYGALNALIVEEGIGRARRGGFDDLVFAAFSFDGAAQALIQEDPGPKLRIHMAQIRPDVNMGDLLKTTVSSQLFTVSGSPRTTVENMEGGRLARQDRGQDARDPVYVVHMEGVDLYDPVTNSVRSTGAEKVAAWFLDSDYDGRCFCVCQAFFPDKSAWAKLGKALGGALDEDAFARLSGTVSLPFPEGEHKRIAVKVIDPRGNEVLRVHRLDGKYGD